MDTPERTILRIEHKDCAALKRKLHHVDGSEARCVQHSVNDFVNNEVLSADSSLSSDAPDTEVGSSESESKDTYLSNSRSCEEQEMDFTEVVMNEEKKFPSLAFILAVDNDGEEPVVVISQRRLANHPPYGLVSRARKTNIQ